MVYLNRSTQLGGYILRRGGSEGRRAVYVLLHQRHPPRSGVDHWHAGPI